MKKLVSLSVFILTACSREKIVFRVQENHVMVIAMFTREQIFHFLEKNGKKHLEYRFHTTRKLETVRSHLGPIEKGI